jgi:uncharacterized protein HemX
MVDTLTWVRIVSPVIQLVVGIVVSAAAGIYIYNYKQTKQTESERTERIDKLERTMFGVEGVETMEGMIDVMESNYETSDENDEDIQKLQRRVSQMESDFEKLEKRLDTLRKKAVDGTDSIKDDKWRNMGGGNDDD